MIDIKDFLSKVEVPEWIEDILTNAKSTKVALTLQDLYDLTTEGMVNGSKKVSYEVDGKGIIDEAVVIKVKNGITVNYIEPYMRRRDPNSMLIGDELPTDKPRFRDVIGYDFSVLRKETFEWLKKQDLATFVFGVGQLDLGIYGIVIAPSNAGFFGLALGTLQRIEDVSKFSVRKKIRIALYVSPPFRHTIFGGKQRVVHYRSEDLHEIFSYNLYPGPSAKKGVYSALLDIGEKEEWLTLHASSVLVITPYGNRVGFLHEGASGGGKSEMNENIHRSEDGTIPFAYHTITGERIKLSLPISCKLRPISDDMTMSHPSIQNNDGGLVIVDGENGWFIRVDHITKYGTDPDIEKLSIYPQRPLLFLNIDAKPFSTALLWEHIEDEPGKPCPNPRFVVGRELINGIITKPTYIHVRSFGIRTPPCTKDKPTYGIVGTFHILPPAIAWIWRLVAPRGHANPSIVGQGMGIEAEGVGSYWPFATGKKVTHANLLLKQIINTPRVKYIITPNQHIGAWKVGFFAEWITREYLARRGGVRFSKEELVPSRGVLLGYSLKEFIFEGQEIDIGFVRTELQHYVGEDAYDEGYKQLYEFFVKETQHYYSSPELDPTGKKILSCLYDKGTLKDFEDILKIDSFIDLDKTG
ncbi:MAG: DUF4914 family protein [Brevinematales bacterium]|nr:DUF4914 family protein [Brevinematales bacterium]